MAKGMKGMGMSKIGKTTVAKTSAASKGGLTIKGGFKAGGTDKKSMKKG